MQERWCPVVTVRHVIVNDRGMITRRRAPAPALVEKTCPYCWATHETTARGSAFCDERCAGRFRAHNRRVARGRARGVAPQLSLSLSLEESQASHDA